MKPESFSRWVVWAIYVALMVEVAVAWSCCPGDSDAYSRGWALTRVFGWSALLALCAALCVSPINRLVRLALGGSGSETWSRELRRGFGIAAASAGIVHASLALGAVPGTRTGLLDTAQLRAGVAALLILTLLLVTSFRSIVRVLRLRSWKELHRLAYVALPLALLHALHGPFVPVRSVLVLAGITLAVGLLRAWPSRRSQ
jgi:DMSO/TMAO reductase YedYZ heme-binding membrane subunit